MMDPETFFYIVSIAAAAALAAVALADTVE
jgi:hypothetical protein